MSEAVEPSAELRHADQLIDAIDDGGIEVAVQWCKTGNQLLFRLNDRVPATKAAVAGLKELNARFKADADFRDAVESYCVGLGLAVHYVEEPAWRFREMTAEETEALNRDQRAGKH